jgi:protocatechuate 3,4-dioxygenase beta subunit
MLYHSLTRRGFLGSVALGAAAWYVPGAFAEALSKTPRMTEGPFYPDKLPLDTDNDLLVINDSITPAVGTIAHVSGRVVTQAGSPVAGAVVEIWQCDNNGAYLHSRSSNRAKRDANFQGFGRFFTSNKGEYYFRTIKPVPYPGRTPHIHFIVKKGNQRLLTTQLFIKGHPGNARDFLYRAVGDAKLRELVQADFTLVKGSKLNEVAASFTLVVGLTPEDGERKGKGKGRRKDKGGRS